MLEYSEVSPPAALADTVECFWVSHQSSGLPQKHLVVPDGCADLLYTRTGSASEIQFVGPMTKSARFTLPPIQLCVAVRFHPGCWTQLVHTNADLLTDRIVLFEALVPKLARHLNEQLMNETEPLRLVSLLAAAISAQPSTRLSSILRYLAHSSQHISLDSLASDVGLSTRHFRRSIRQQTGLSPKLLARIFRFRRAAACLHAGVETHADIASSCGYFDQSHFISEYRYFTGTTPAAVVAPDKKIQGGKPFGSDSNTGFCLRPPPNSTGFRLPNLEQDC